VLGPVIVCNYVHMLEHFDDIIVHAITVVFQCFANGTVVQVRQCSCSSMLSSSILRLWGTFTEAALIRDCASIPWICSCALILC